MLEDYSVYLMTEVPDMRATNNIHFGFITTLGKVFVKSFRFALPGKFGRISLKVQRIRIDSNNVLAWIEEWQKSEDNPVLYYKLQGRKFFSRIHPLKLSLIHLLEKKE